MSVSLTSRISASLIALAIVAMTWLPTVTVDVPHTANTSIAVSAAVA